jgi:hypothetical protein
MNTREAKRRAYEIAAEALRQAMESDLMDVADHESDADADRLLNACQDLKRYLERRCTTGAMSDG